MNRFSILAICATLLLTACKSKESPTPPVQSGDDPLPTLPEPEQQPATEFDRLVDELELADVTQPGPIHGAWELHRRDGTKLATLRIRHEEGSAELRGAVKMADGALVKLNPASRWMDETLTAHWDLDYDGRRYRFAMTDGEIKGDRVQLRLAEQRDGSITDGYLVRASSSASSR